MNLEIYEKYITHVLSSTIQGKQPDDIPTEIDMEFLFRLCRFHRIENIIYLALQDKLTSETKTLFERAYEKSVYIQAMQYYYLEAIENAFEAVKDFLKCCKEAGIKTYASIVTGFDEREINVENCEKIAKELGAEFRNREFITNGY